MSESSAEAGKTAAFEGSCLCGVVTIKITRPPDLAANCHCMDCRRFFAAGHNSLALFARDAVTIDGALSGYSLQAESGNEITRHFCPTCGSPVCAESAGFGDLVAVPLTLLPDDPDAGLRPRISVFTRSAASWDPPLADIPAFEAGPPTGR